ncbi:hypothetical protein EJB05_14020, partial [Eragrostis curvula]
MEILLSAFLAEMTTRSINFFINKTSKPTALDVENRLCNILLRAQVIVDEAMGRCITNQAMLQQLDMMRDAMHRGYYMLDVFRCQSLDEGDTKDQVTGHSLSKLNSLKGFCSSSRNTQIKEQLKKAHDDLSSMITDLQELVVFLTSYPRLYRQPYSMHILLENCMFGRQTEIELVINFLLRTQPHGAEELEVLPIVGPRKVGKSTLVAHVCKDERVRDHFSKVWFLRDQDFTAAMKHQHCVLNSDKDGRLLIIVDLVGDINEEEWDKLHSAAKRCLRSGSKIIVTSQFDKIIKFGTTHALSLKHLSHEAHWYFFKTLTFGSTDPEMHPRLAYLAMEISRIMNGDFLRANIAAYLLRENIDIRFWYKVLVFLRDFMQKHASIFGEHAFDLVDQNRPSYFGRMATTSRDFVIYHQYHQRFQEEEVPKTRILDVIYGEYYNPMASQTKIHWTGAEVITGDAICSKKTIALLEELGLPKGLLPLEDIQEFGYNRATGFMWLVEGKKKVQHTFKKIKQIVSYAVEVTAFVEKGKRRKITGARRRN